MFNCKIHGWSHLNYTCPACVELLSYANSECVPGNTLTGITNLLYSEGVDSMETKLRFEKQPKFKFYDQVKSKKYNVVFTVECVWVGDDGNYMYADSDADAHKEEDLEIYVLQKKELSREDIEKAWDKIYPKYFESISKSSESNIFDALIKELQL